MTVKIKIKDKLENDTLDLSFCELQEVPIREIMTVKKAGCLDLSNNNLILLPNTIVNLRNIVKLDLSKNFLTEIPENIGEMTQLRHLDLYSNQISRLPLSIGDLKNLKWLDLKDNPLTPAIANVAGSCSDSAACIACARKIVTFFANLKQNIDEEKQRRITAAATAVTNSDVSVKKESKKRKKKNIENKQDDMKEKSYCKQPTVTDVCQVDQKLNNYSHVKRSTLNKFFTLIYSVIMSPLIVGLLTFLIFIILPKYNQSLSDNIMNYLQDQTNLPIKYYQQLGIEKSNFIVNEIANIFNKTMIFLKEQYENAVKLN